ncbi:MAG: serine hydrolase domain-containing protein [Planctomycetota bacterium]
MSPAKSRWCAFVLVLIAIPSSLHAEVVIPSRFGKEIGEKVDVVAKSEVDRQQLVGLAVGLVRGGRIVYLAGYGFEDRESKTPVTRDTRFRWASVSKPVTAVAAMQLVEKGALDLNADIREHVPEFPDHGERISPRHLLCHQGGIVHYSNGKVVRTRRTYDSPHPFENVIIALDTFKESPLLNKPGEKFNYSTHGYILLSAAVERAAGKPFAEYVQQNVAQPIGMKTFEPDYQWREIPGRAVGYRKIAGQTLRSTDTDVSWKLGGGGFLSSIDDLTQFGAALVTQQLLDKKTYEQMWKAQKLADGKPTNYSLGFRVSGKGLDRQVSHSGAQEKTRTYLLMVPGRKVAVAVMTNSEYAKPEPIANKLLPLVLPQAAVAKVDAR